VETPYDWITVAIFAGLIVLFLQRSTAEVHVDRIVDYLPPAICCALGNYLGNNGHPILAILVILTIPVYVWVVLKPFGH
jgi:Ca2+/Na+ antiporter